MKKASDPGNRGLKLCDCVYNQGSQNTNIRNPGERGGSLSNSNSENRNRLSRRQALLLPATAGMGAALALPAMASDSTKTAAHQEPGICSTPRSAVANTQYGKVRGFVDPAAF